MGTEVDLQKSTPSLLELRDSVLETIKLLDKLVSPNGEVRYLSQSMIKFEERYDQLLKEYAKDPEESRHLREVHSALVGPYYSAWRRHLNPHVISSGTENGSSRSYQ